MTFRNYIDSDFDHWLNMTIALFPEQNKDDLTKQLHQHVGSGKLETFFALDGQKYAGFLSVSLRTDYVEGANSSPVGYIEAIYIYPTYRKKGLARNLYFMAEDWAREKGCTQMGSDTWESDTAAQEFHLRLGFREEDRLVHYLKII